MIDVGTLGGGSMSTGTGINNFGDVVGWGYTSGGLQRPFLYSSGALTQLGTLGGQHAAGLGINDAGVIAGSSYTSAGEHHGFYRDSGGGMHDLGALGGWSAAYDLNNAGEIVGSTPPYTACLWDAGGLHVLGTLGGARGYAIAINEVSQVAGYAQNGSGSYHAFLLSPGGGMVDLGTLGGAESRAYGINDAGQVVGYSQIAGGGERGCLWSEGNAWDLNTLLDPSNPANDGWTITTATDISGTGYIVGTGTNPDGLMHAYRLDPIIGGDGTDVPEPASLSLGLLVLGGLVASRRRRWG